MGKHFSAQIHRQITNTVLEVLDLKRYDVCSEIMTSIQSTKSWRRFGILCWEF